MDQRAKSRKKKKIFHTEINRITSAIHKMDIGELKYYFDAGQCSADGADYPNFYPLIESVKTRNVALDLDTEDERKLEMLELLMHHGADVRTEAEKMDRENNACKVTSAMWASKWGFLRCLKRLVESGADLKRTAGYGETALNLAARYAQADCVKFLLVHVPSSMVNHRDKHGHTALMDAASCPSEKGHLCMQHLLAAGADPNVKGKSGSTVLSDAVKFGNVEAVRLLIDKGAELHSKQLLRAIRFGKVDVMALLLDKGFDIEEKFNGQTYLITAARYADLDALKLLVERGADLENRNQDGKTALMVVGETGKRYTENLKGYSYYKASMDFLLEKGALVNSTSHDGSTPLLLALRGFRTRWNMATQLLEHGADPTLCKSLQKWLHRAVMYGEDALVRAMIMQGFPPLDVSLAGFGGPDESQVLIPDATKAYEYTENIESYLEKTPVSPLAIALLYLRPDVARYFVSNQFFTHFDIVRLCWDPEIRRMLQDVDAKEVMEILDFLSTKPASLLNLSLVAVSSAVSQNFMWDCENGPHGMDSSDSEDIDTYSRAQTSASDGKGVPHSRHNLSSQVFSPTFKERVHKLGLPPALQRFLLHQTPSSSVPPEAWDHIPLE